MKTALVIDFDGTITDDDFFVYLKEAYFDENSLAPWQVYLDGGLSHFDALKQIFGTLRVGADNLHDLIARVKVDEWAILLFELCHNMQIPIYIASAGCDYYINRILGNEIKRYGITLVTNGSTYSETEGLVMESPQIDSLYYDENTGISKRKVVEILKDEGYRVIFAGDGPPDIEPAKIADVVFAKKILLEKCIEHGITTETFDSCRDICMFIESEITR